MRTILSFSRMAHVCNKNATLGICSLVYIEVWKEAVRMRVLGLDGGDRRKAVRDKIAAQLIQNYLDVQRASASLPDQ